MSVFILSIFNHANRLKIGAFDRVSPGLQNPPIDMPVKNSSVIIFDNQNLLCNFLEIIILIIPTSTIVDGCRIESCCVNLIFYLTVCLGHK